MNGVLSKRAGEHEQAGTSNYGRLGVLVSGLSVCQSLGPAAGKEDDANGVETSSVSAGCRLFLLPGPEGYPTLHFC